MIQNWGDNNLNPEPEDDPYVAIGLEVNLATLKARLARPMSCQEIPGIIAACRSRLDYFFLESELGQFLTRQGLIVSPVEQEKQRQEDNFQFLTNLRQTAGYPETASQSRQFVEISSPIPKADLSILKTSVVIDTMMAPIIEGILASSNANELKDKINFLETHANNFSNNGFPEAQALIKLQLEHALKAKIWFYTATGDFRKLIHLLSIFQSHEIGQAIFYSELAPLISKLTQKPAFQRALVFELFTILTREGESQFDQVCEYLQIFQMPLVPFEQVHQFITPEELSYNIQRSWLAGKPVEFYSMLEKLVENGFTNTAALLKIKSLKLHVLETTLLSFYGHSSREFKAKIRPALANLGLAEEDKLTLVNQHTLWAEYITLCYELELPRNAELQRIYARQSD